MDTYQVKQTFEGFADINDIPEDEEERFKELVDEMDDLENGLEDVTATPEVRDRIGKARDTIMEQLGLDPQSDEGIKVLGTLNELIQGLTPEQERREIEEIGTEEVR